MPNFIPELVKTELLADCEQPDRITQTAMGQYEKTLTGYLRTS